MNLLQVTAASFRLYSNHIGWHLLGGLALVLSTLVGVGLMCGALLAGMLLAIPFGPDGGWIRQPLAAALILLTLGAGALGGSVVIFASLGAFVHVCAQIGAGVREITVLGFLDYMRRFGHVFWAIGILQAMLGSLAALPFVIASMLLSSAWEPVLFIGAVFGILAFFLAQWPLWLAFGAQVVERGGVLGSIGLAVRTSLRAPISSLAGLLLLGIAFSLPLPMLLFYPVYFYFVFAPLAADFGLVYYEASRGMLK
ncbi:MAG: hypothetical protein M1530_04535 [Candidatus Marsarchaeota archaeon]|nr:hypothetical protein [Candidatus Marsarchaeota archaeon]